MATDKQLFKIIRDLLVAGFAATTTPPSPIPTGLEVKQANQPTQQGVPVGPVIFMTKLPDNRYGFRGTSDIWDAEAQKKYHTETQQYESTFQLNCLITQDPTDTAQPTQIDVLNYAAYIMQSDATIRTLQAQGIGIERVSQIRQTPFQDERDRFEYSPSFDFVLTHKQSVTSEIDVLQSIELNIYEI